MFFLPFFVVLQFIQSQIIHRIRESNAACGNNTLNFAPLPSGPFGAWAPNVYYWVSIASPPSHGKLNIDEGATIPYVDTRDLSMIYTPQQDFSGVDRFALTVSRINYGVDWTLNNYAIVVTHTVNVIPMPSIPILNTETLDINDPDGRDIEQRYSVVIDGCGNDSVTFVATPSTFKQHMINRLCNAAREVSTARAFVKFGDKSSLSQYCPEYETRIAILSTYVNIPVFNLSIPDLVVEYIDDERNSTNNYTLIQDPRSDLGYVHLSDSREISFVYRDSSSFSATDLESCDPREYSLVRVSSTTNTSSFLMPDTVWQICIADRQRPPYIFPLRVKHIWGGVPVRFYIPVADFNDDTIGIDDGIVSQYAFKNSENSGIIFSVTNFTYSMIYKDDCSTPLMPDTIYSSHNGFCYIASIDAPAEVAYVVAIDGAGAESSSALLEFDASIVISVCDASTSNSSTENECTSKGFESNSKFGRRNIPIQISIFVFPPEERTTQLDEISIVIEQLPTYGILIDNTGLEVVIGAKYTLSTPLYYIGNNDYFNYAVISAVVDSGLVEEFETFTDLKGIPFDGCQSETGCPDSFMFSYQHRTMTGVAGRGRYDVYVRAVGSEPMFYKNEEPPVTRDDPYQYANRYDSNIPVRIGTPYYHPRLRRTIINDLVYNDPDGDLWEVEFMINTIHAYIGDIKEASDNYNLRLVEIDMDCKVEADNSTRFCGGSFVLIGLPSDLKSFLAQKLWFYNWPSTGTESADEPVYFTLAKRYMKPGNNPMVYLINGNIGPLQKYEDALNECLDKKLASINISRSFVIPSYLYLPQRQSFRSLFSVRNIPVPSEATVFFKGIFGESTISFVDAAKIDDPKDVQSYRCWSHYTGLLLAVAEIEFKALEFGWNHDYACAYIYDTLGPSTVESIFTDDIRNNELVDQYTVGPYIVHYLFKWKGWRGAPYPPLEILPPLPPPTDFWVMLGDALFAGAISEPSPENIALAVVGIFLLLLPIPPIAIFGKTTMQTLAKIGPAARSPAMVGVRDALTVAASKGVVRKTTARAKGWRQDIVFQFVVSITAKVKNVLSVFKSRAASAIARARARLPRPSTSFELLVTRLGNKLSRPITNGLRKPKVPARPVKPARPSKFNLNLFRREMDIPSPAIPKPNLFTRALNRIPTPKGRSLRLSLRYSRNALKRKFNRIKEQIRGRIAKARAKAKAKAKAKGRTKKGRTRKRRERRKQRTKRKKELRKKSPKSKLAKGIPRPRPKKAKPKSKFLPFAFALRLISAFLSWIAYAFYLVMLTTYHVSQWIWERIFEDDDEEEDEEDESTDDDE